MKKILHTIVFLAASGTLAMAGGHIKRPVEQVELVEQLMLCRKKRLLL